MRALEKFICRNWIWLTIGITLTKVAVERTYQERGRIAIGGEWLIVPVILVLVYLTRGIMNQISELLEDSEDE